jgi:prepilin-type processing-associated H-X9-DG protein
MAKDIQCANNLNNIKTGEHMYSNDYNAWIVPVYDEASKKVWDYVICRDYLSLKEDFFVCPRWPSDGWTFSWTGVSYGKNHGLGVPASFGYSNIKSHYKIVEFKHPSQTVSISDSRKAGTDWAGYFLTPWLSFGVSNIHNNGTNLLHLDGHISKYKRNSFGLGLYWLAVDNEPRN